MYPMIKSGVTLGTFHYDGSDDTHYYMENADGEMFEISQHLWDLLLHTDGTHFPNLLDESGELLSLLKRHGILQTSRFCREEGAFNRFILFQFDRGIRRFSVLCKLLNAVLPLAAIVIFPLGVFFMGSYKEHIDVSFSMLLYVALVICSSVLHEMGHVIAGLAYRVKMIDAGILLFGVFPVGAYVYHNKKKSATTRERIQFYLAGIEMNLILAGIFLLAAVALAGVQSLTLIMAANINVYLALINLFPISRLDGEAILSAAFGVDSISKVAKKALRSKESRQALLHAGLPGYVCFVVFIITLISKRLFMVLVGLGLYSVLSSVF